MEKKREQYADIKCMLYLFLSLVGAIYIVGLFITFNWRWLFDYILGGTNNRLWVIMVTFILLGVSYEMSKED